jgi:deoxyribonuclease-4
MIRIGPAGVPICSKDRSTIGGIKTVKQLGLNAMEIEFVRQVYVDNKAAEKIGKVAKQLDVELSVHAPYFINLCSEDRAKLGASKQRILQSCERAHWMGAGIVVFHPGFYGKLTKEQAFDRVKSACEDMIDKMKEKGIDVLLGPETMGKQTTFGTLDELIDLAKQVKGLVPVIDWAHLYARAGGQLNFGAVFDSLKTLGLKHYHCHVTCVHFISAGPGKGNERYHLTLDKKRPDFKPLIEEIKKRKLDITLISESPVLEKDALVLKRMFEE